MHVEHYSIVFPEYIFAIERSIMILSNRSFKKKESKKKLESLSLNNTLI